MSETISGIVPSMINRALVLEMKLTVVRIPSWSYHSVLRFFWSIDQPNRSKKALLLKVGNRYG